MNTFTLRCAGRAGILVTAIVCSPLAMAVGKAGLWEATTTMNMGGAMPQMSPEQLGLARPGIEGPVRNLYVVGHWTRPGGGITPVIVSAMHVASAITGSDS